VRRHEAGPAAGTAAHVEPFGIGRKLIKGKDGEVVAKDALSLPWGHALLIEALPLIAETGDGAGVEVGVGCHRQEWAAVDP
jgi:hypothetical protein